MDEDPVMSANLNPMSVQWQPPTMLEVLFTQLDVGQKFAAYHDAISEKTILRMAIEIFGNPGFWTSGSATGRYRHPNIHG